MLRNLSSQRRQPQPGIAVRLFFVALVASPGWLLIAVGHPLAGIALCFSSTIVHVFVSDRRDANRGYGKHA
jgi:hypothetical protein